MAAAAAGLETQSQELVQAVAVFKLGGAADGRIGAAAPTHAHGQIRHAQERGPFDDFVELA